MVNAAGCVATLSVTLASTYLKLCDGGVTDLSGRGCVFASVETFHFVVQLADKVDLERSGAWRRAIAVD